MNFITMTITIRPFHSGELADIVDVWNATMSADPISSQRLMLDFILDAHFDPETLLVAEKDAELVGFVLGLTARGDMPSDNAVGTGVIAGFGVLEEHRGQGIGRQLLDTLEHYWQAKGVSHIQVGPWIPTYLAPGIDQTAYPGAVEFFESCGYKAGGKPVSMRALLTNYQASSDVPGICEKLQGEGVTIRPAVAADATGLIAFAVDQFPHWESYVRGSLRSLVAANDANTLHVALDGDTIIGFAMTTGERFGPFGVNGDYRGRGVGAVLLSRALCSMRAANQHLAYFLWTSDQTARLYNRHGFEIVRRFTMVSK